MAQQAGDRPKVAAYRALEFFDDPDLDSYLKLKKASKACQAWDAVRMAVLSFLEKGRGEGPAIHGMAAAGASYKVGLPTPVKQAMALSIECLSISPSTRNETKMP